MPKIAEEVYYNGSRERIERLGLGPLVDEIKTAVQGFTLLVKEQTDANGGAAVRKLLDGRFAATGGWTKKTAGRYRLDKMPSRERHTRLRGRRDSSVGMIGSAGRGHDPFDGGVSRWTT